MSTTFIRRFICIEVRVHCVSFKVAACFREQVIILVINQGAGKTRGFIFWLSQNSLYTAEMATKSEVVSNMFIFSNAACSVRAVTANMSMYV